MYYDYDEFDSCYEPSAVDEIFEEAMEKFKDILKENVKSDLKNIQDENIRLRKENEELKDKARDLNSREREVERREKELESLSERNFYSKKFSELLMPLEDQLDMWYVTSVSELVPKCDLCDDNREIEYVSSTGKKIKGKCDCDEYHSVYKVEYTELKSLDFCKTKSNRKGKQFVLTPKYDCSEYDNAYFKLKIQKLEQKFDINNVSEYSPYGKYGGFTGFTTKEECQKYCDWLSSQKENN